MTRLFILLILQSIMTPLLFSSKKCLCFLSTRAPFEQWRPFFPFSFWSSSRGISVSRGPKQRENRKVWTPCSTNPALLLISTYMPRSSAPSGRGECDFYELNEACDGVGRWQLDTIIYSIISMNAFEVQNCWTSGIIRKFSFKYANSLALAFSSSTI